MTPRHQVGRLTIFCADVRKWAREYAGPPAHAMVTDPPYHLGDTGFMGKTWDDPDGGVSFDPATWATFMPHLYPGAFGISFAGAQMQSFVGIGAAIMQAGFMPHPAIALLAWVQAQGWPKGVNVSKAVDKAVGAEREVVGKKAVTRDFQRNRSDTGNGAFNDRQEGHGLSSAAVLDVTAPATALAEVWDGWYYGCQALRPCVEMALLFQAPYAGRPLDSITRTGAGALNVNSARIGVGEMVPGGGNGKAHNHSYGSGHTNGERPLVQPHTSGRFPANLALVHLSLPVVRLTGNLAPGIIEAVRGFYNGYSRVRELRQKRANDNLQDQCRAEVLQSRVQKCFHAEGEDAQQGGDHVSGVRLGIPGVQVNGEGRPQEVLQHSVQGKIQEEAGRTTCCQIRDAEDSRGEGENIPDKDRPRLHTTVGETPELERRKITQQRVCECDRSHAKFRGTEHGEGNVADRGVCFGAPLGNGDEVGETSCEVRDCPPHQRGESRQQAGEPDDPRQSGTLCRAQGDSPAYRGTAEGECGSACGEQPLEVLACDVPPQWVAYFEPTGEDLGCRRVGVKRVKAGVWGATQHTQPGNGGTLHQSFNGTPSRDPGVADADGLETTDAWACEPGCPVALLNEQAGERPAGGSNAASGERPSMFGVRKPGAGVSQHAGEAGPVGRFYKNCDFALDVEEQLAGAVPWKYAPKASTTEREAGLAGRYPCIRCGQVGTLHHLETDSRGIEHQVRCRRCSHVAVKPLSLVKYLATLLAPPAAYAPRRILVPFAGVMSEAIGCLLSGGWEEVVAIEQSEEFCDIGAVRAEYWQARKGAEQPALLEVA